MKILSVAVLSVVASFAQEVLGYDVFKDGPGVGPLAGGDYLSANELGTWGIGDFYISMTVTGQGGDIGPTEPVIPGLNGGRFGVLFSRSTHQGDNAQDYFPKIGPLAIIYQNGKIAMYNSATDGINGRTYVGGGVSGALPNPTDAALTRQIEISRVGNDLLLYVNGVYQTLFRNPDTPNAETHWVEDAPLMIGKNSKDVVDGLLNMNVEHICVADRKEYCESGASGFVSGDPHIKTWGGKMYDFHGSCDLVMLSNPDYNEGQGMDIHLRTKLTKQWSFVSNAAIRIGEDILEVSGAERGSAHQYWLNGEAGKDLSFGISGHSISYEEGSGGSSHFFIELNDNGEGIRIKTWKGFVRVDFTSPSGETFGNSLGLLGSYPSGSKLGRDGMTVIDDNNAFGLEWQVLPEEAKLFHNLEGAQAPEQCVMPDVSKARRRLRESTISLEDAQLACARVTYGVEQDACIFDVLATNDKSMAGAY